VNHPAQARPHRGEAEGRVVLVSQEQGEAVEALARSLEQLRYRVDLVPPPALDRGPTDAAPRVVHLGRRAWPAERLRSLAAERRPVAQVLALERPAFAWASELVEGCTDFLSWPCSPLELKLRLQRGFPARAGAGDERAETLAARFADHALIGRAPAFLDSLAAIERFARCLAPVLVQGETGTGKELAARALHELGERRGRPFVAVNCGALPDSLVESELFGHERGAFTDAREARAGLVAEAAGGTLFLDEIESLSAKGQATLLRFLETREFRPLGGRLRQADVRLVAAGNADLAALARRGSFRRDLFYRLDVLTVTLPPLRARPGDAVILAEHFARRFARQYGGATLRIGPDLRDWLNGRRWPGNVRELENLVHCCVLGGRLPLREEGEPAPLGEAGERPSFSEAKRSTLEAFERRYLTEILRESGGNVSQAAREAGKERRAFGKLLKKHGIAPDDLREPEA